VAKKVYDNRTTSSEHDKLNSYDKLHFIPVEEKTPRWGAQVLTFMKGNSVPFINPDEVEKRRKDDRGEIDKAAYKQMIDPLTTDGHGNQVGGKAEYFHADWKSCPIFVHLNNIMEAKIEQIPLNIVVSASDQFAMTERMKENAKIIGRDQMRRFLNHFLEKLQLPQLTKFDDPFDYVEQLKAGQMPQPKTKGGRLQAKYNKQVPTGLMSSLKDIVDDNESLAMLNTIQKLGPEVACEVGIKYYMLQVNKFVVKARKAIRDIKNHNGHLFRFYTSLTTGRPITEYEDPRDIRVLPFDQEDLSDLKGWYKESWVTFGDFVQMFGANRTKDELRDIFEQHRKFNGNNYPSYESCTHFQRTNAKIKIGYAEFETQNMDVFVSYEFLGNEKYKKVPTHYKMPKSFNNAKREERHYNVWYKFYYLPQFMDNKMFTANVDEQAKYIYDFGKLQDQQRDGDDFRYSKCSLAGSLIRDKMTWADIIDSFMPKINLLWFKFQNEMVNSIPNGGFFAKELVSMMAKVADGADNNNQTAGIEFMKQFRQTGYGVAGLLKDENGKLIGDGSPFRPFKNTMLEDAFKNLEGMMNLYNLMMQALSQNAITEGAGSKPRQNATGIEATINASGQATYFIEKQYTDSVLNLAEKHIHYFKQIVDEGESERLEDFMSIVGEALGMSMQTVMNIPYHNLGLTVQNAMTDDQKMLVNSLAEKLASAGVLMPEDVFFITMTEDVKWAYAILSLKAKQGRKALAEQQQQQQQQLMQMKQMDLQIEVAKIKASGEQVMANTNLLKQWDFKIDQMMSQLKGSLQMQIKQQTGQNKTDEMITQSNIEKINRTGEHAPKENAA
jgi:hypothetical protein